MGLQTVHKASCNACGSTRVATAAGASNRAAAIVLLSLSASARAGLHVLVGMQLPVLPAPVSRGGGDSECRATQNPRATS